MDEEIIVLLKNGKKLEAIKRCQDIGGLTFQEAKSYVEEMEVNSLSQIDAKLDVKTDIRHEIIELIKSGKKLEAIKKVQDARGVEFAEAKAYIEELQPTTSGGKAQSNDKEKKIPSKDNFSNSTVCDVCGKHFDKNQITTIDLDNRKIIVCSIECQNKALEKTQVKSKIPFWQKGAGVLVVVILMKACSVATNGGENYGKTHQFFCWIGDTIIPWPKPYYRFERDLENSYEEFEESKKIILKGKVVDSADGSDLPGASIIIEGTEDGVVSDQNGEFEIAAVNNENSTLVITFFGYETVTTKISEFANAHREGLEIIIFSLKRKEGIENEVYDESIEDD